MRDEPPAPQSEPTPHPDRLPALAIRGGIGGVLMGLANLVPGVSGGTMLLAAGVYTRFIEAVGEVTTFKFKRDALITLTSIILPAAIAFILLAGTVKDLVVGYRWVMYALFIGLTLGGVPMIWRMIKAPIPKDQTFQCNCMTRVWIFAVVGFLCMAALAMLQSSGATGGSNNDNFIFLLIAGIAGASAMILPGVSGGYLMLVLGVYVPILAGVSAFKDALPVLGDFDSAVLIDLGLSLVLPVGLGAVAGVAGVSNLLRWLLKRHEKATLGFLLGLLVGAVIGLWPFQQTVEPQPGQLIKDQAVTFGTITLDDTGEEQTLWHYVDSKKPVERDDFPTAFFTPSAVQVAGAIGLVVLGLGGTLLIDRVQREQ